MEKTPLSKTAQPKKQAGFIAAIAILAILLLVGIFLFFNQRKENAEMKMVLEGQKEELKQELGALSKEYENLKTDNDTLNYQLELEKSKIELMLKEIKNDKNRFYRQINRYKTEISSLKALVANYAVQVDSLRDLSKALTQENTIYKEKTELQNLAIDSLALSNEELKDIVQKVSIIRPVNFYAYGANRRDKPMTKLRRTAKVKIDFILPKNVIVEKGVKTIYALVKRPDGKIVSNHKGETFTFKGEESMYTVKREVMYEQEVIPVSLFWENKDKTLVKGEYSVDLVLGNDVLGTTTFSLK